jgi:hypothetical protein
MNCGDVSRRVTGINAPSRVTEPHFAFGGTPMPKEQSARFKKKTRSPKQSWTSLDVAELKQVIGGASANTNADSHDPNNQPSGGF